MITEEYMGVIQYSLDNSISNSKNEKPYFFQFGLNIDLLSVCYIHIAKISLDCGSFSVVNVHLEQDS